MEHEAELRHKNEMLRVEAELKGKAKIDRENRHKPRENTRRSGGAAKNCVRIHPVSDAYSWYSPQYLNLFLPCQDANVIRKLTSLAINMKSLGSFTVSKS